MLLLQAVGNSVLSQEEMVTMLAEVEAVLNSRPIAPLTPDPNDGEALTPAHLLIGAGLRSLPHELEEGENVKAISSWKRWRLISALKRTFWRAWPKDYILGLQGKSKWQAAKPRDRPRDNPRGQSSVAAVVAQQSRQRHRGPRRPCSRSRSARSRKHI